MGAERLSLSDVDVHLVAGLRAFECRDAASLDRHRDALASRDSGPSPRPEYLALTWRSLWLQGERQGALEAAQQAVQQNPGMAAALLDLTDLLSEMRSEAEALESLLSCLDDDSQEPELWYEAGLLAEAIGDAALCRRCWEKVWMLEHARPPEHRMWLSKSRFEEVAEAAFEGLPEEIKGALGNVVIFIEDYPERWLLDGLVGDPRLLGLFDGVGRASEYASDVLQDGPSRIYLYRWNIERVATSLEDVERQIAITLRHEIGHYLGLDEDELHGRGLG